MGVRKKTIIATATLLLGILLFVALVVIPLLRGIARDARDLEAQYLKVFQAASAEREVVEFQRFSLAQQENFKALENIFVDAETPIGFIRFVEEIAASSNLKVRITPGKPKKEKGAVWPVMDFQLASQGTYPQFLRFLEKLENGPYLLSVENTSVTRDQTFLEEDLPREVRFTLLLEVFTVPLPKVSTP